MFAGVRARAYIGFAQHPTRFVFRGTHPTLAGGTVLAYGFGGWNSTCAWRVPASDGLIGLFALFTRYV
jgi:hypothetical protein